MVVVLLFRATGSWHLDFSCCDVGSALAALRPVTSSWSRAQTCVPCTGGQILYHWVTRGVHDLVFPQVRALFGFASFFLVSFFLSKERIQDTALLSCVSLGLCWLNIGEQTQTLTV